ncbi:class V aminotransferase [Sorangium cellulosum]|uniref:Class V aminotransferase n=1 Tax=Sorangium cellulosum TaxID=56 RepID=A0A4V0NDG1_SORCE|nr:aminotransferase class V-fold PLP-dependent enzyme [Sorangium cellulosum]AUX22552.1 class V aminotransferase [Sorangium cellulosum]
MSAQTRPTPRAGTTDRRALLDRIREDFVGLDTEYALADGLRKRRRYLDSAATTLVMQVTLDCARAFLRHCANTHSTTHFSAAIAGEAYAWAHDRVLRFLGAPPRDYAAVFTGSGATAALNRVAEVLAAAQPDRPMALVSLMEHHANDLPHRRHASVLHVPLTACDDGPGPVDLDALEAMLRENAGRVRYVAVTAASNVTGLLNPLAPIARLAHAHGARVVVDGAQIAAHRAVSLADDDIDAFVFSGHKAYAPGSPGVLVIKRELLDGVPPGLVGGGIVEHVSTEGFELTPHLPDREEAGTPNVVGAVLLASALEVLAEIGMDSIAEAEDALVEYALDRLATVPGLRIYGTRTAPRSGVVAFNLSGIEHAVTAQALNDAHNIAVRNGCFCAHPYVRHLLLPELWALDADGDEDLEAQVMRRRGMVRASFGLYSTPADVDALVDALVDIGADEGAYRRRLEATSDERGAPLPQRRVQFSAPEYLGWRLREM